MIVTNARAKPLDPSLPQGSGVVPTGAKVGIDATRKANYPDEISVPGTDEVNLEAYIPGYRSMK